MDDKLALAYNQELRALSPASAALVRTDQREWLRFLDQVCPAGVKSSRSVAECLSEHYTVRLGQLDPGAQQVQGMVFYVRSQVVVKPAPPPAKGDARSFMDPGFGYGEFSWLQIDRPTPAQSAWNDAAYEAALAAETASSNGGAPSFEAAVDGTGYLYAFAHLVAANNHLIDTNFTTQTYTWGMAHPLTGTTAFLWWLDKGRAVTVHDVFEPSSGWQTRLTVPAFASLQKEPGPKALFSGDELAKGIAEGVVQIAHWGVTTEGLTITFAEYEVGPYSLGMPSITIPWAELQPLLNTDLHPGELPRKLPDRN